MSNEASSSSSSLSAAAAPALAVVSLLPAQRRQRIVDFLRRHGAVTLAQLEQALEVSLSTLRRDLDGLAADGVIDRTHGGALLRQQGYTAFEPDSVASSELSPREKRAIGAAAAATLQPHQSVIFDSGSTVLEAARAAVQRGIPFTAVTNDLAIAQVLGGGQWVQVHVLGGHLRHGSQTLVGDALIEAVRAMQADVLLCGAHAITDGVITETSAEVAAVKRALMRAAVCRRLLADASKFRPRTFMQVATLADVEEIICDASLASDEAERIRTLGKRLTLVPV
jgi:DeoR family transcriptional regulator of aga operon